MCLRHGARLARASGPVKRNWRRSNRVMAVTVSSKLRDCKKGLTPGHELIRKYIRIPAATAAFRLSAPPGMGREIDSTPGESATSPGTP